MSEALNERDQKIAGFVAAPALTEYAARYSEQFDIQRTDGIVEVRMHTGGGAALFSRPLLNAWGQLLRDLAADRDNEVLIITGTDAQWIGRRGRPSFVRRTDATMAR